MKVAIHITNAAKLKIHNTVEVIIPDEGKIAIKALKKLIAIEIYSKDRVPLDIEKMVINLGKEVALDSVELIKGDAL